MGMADNTREAIEVTGFEIFSHCGRLARWLRDIKCSIGNFIQAVRSVERLAGIFGTEGETRRGDNAACCKQKLQDRKSVV